MALSGFDGVVDRWCGEGNRGWEAIVSRFMLSLLGGGEGPFAFRRMRLN